VGQHGCRQRHRPRPHHLHGTGNEVRGQFLNRFLSLQEKCTPGPNPTTLIYKRQRSKNLQRNL
jgi:hypothetical protein